MAKRIVVCCDGTWNTLEQRMPTNVAAVHQAIADDDGNVRQTKHYVEGVGNRTGSRFAGGAFGLGLSDNVLEAYRYVVESYDPGDELFFFGFSRGAYTARSTVGLIRNCGVLLRQNENRINAAYRLYRGTDKAKTGPDSAAARNFRAQFSHREPDPTPIRFIGVWDTVGALGIPLGGLRFVNVFNRRWQFHDTQLSSTVRSAFHALAIDEKRPSFTPAVWKPSTAAAGQQREQVWFAGDHCDVGGGHKERELSDLALGWIAACARSCGLAFEPRAFGAPTSDPLGRLHTMPVPFLVLGTLDRPIGETDEIGESLASSAELRAKAPLRPPYDPPSLRTYLSLPRHKTTSV